MKTRTVILDVLWKGMIYDLLPYIILFHYPYQYHLIDWSREPEFLNLELDQLIPNSQQQGRVADVLVKLYLKGGGNVLFLFHIEIQGYPDVTFPKRVYQMLYRTEETLGVCPEILAIYVDDTTDFNPKIYTHTVWETYVEVGFKTFKLLENPPTTFNQPDNPYTLILELVYWALKKNNPGEDVIMQIQIDLIKRLVSHNYPSKIIKSCLIFLKYYIIFDNKKKWTIFEHKIDKIMGTVQMKGVVQLVREYLREQAKTEIREAKAEVKGAKAEAKGAKAEAKGAKAEAKDAKAQTKKVQADALKKLEASIRLMLQNGIAIETIAQVTDIPVEKILNIQKRLPKSKGK